MEENLICKKLMYIASNYSRWFGMEDLIGLGNKEYLHILKDFIKYNKL